MKWKLFVLTPYHHLDATNKAKAKFQREIDEK